MQFLVAVLVFAVVTVAVFAAISLLDDRKAQARILRDRLASVDKPVEQTTPDAAFLRDEVLSRISAFDGPAFGVEDPLAAFAATRDAWARA